ncbi:CapA family protein [Actibacterium sp. MT2.3-13A]|uniref:CapA family protein n=1 Tax=Actibacterium sp. MT2.3-13A TaxID=2828332 RepID=UPI001BA78170|nr:CapA family protein [Actibacterium sp. MT2.3-13A]
MKSDGRDPAAGLRIFLAGDVMTGRGIDQILPHPGDPRLYEGWVTSAEDYVRLAERVSGPIPRRAPFAYVWGALLADLAARGCDLRIVNLETAITRAGAPWPKAINYRMSPENAGVLGAADLDACTLANNHVLDWGEAGLVETLEVLERAGIGQAGAGRTAPEAEAPLVLEVAGKGRALVAALGSGTSGVPRDWQAGDDRPGVALLPDDPDAAAALLRARVAPLRRPGDLLILSVHWGANWGFDVPFRQREMARALIDRAGVDLVFGHSSHHPKGIELYRGKLIVYGAGDLINDYEGIGGQEGYRPDLGLAYVADLDPATGRLAGLEMLPYRRRAFRLTRAGAEDVDWLAHMLRRDSLPGDAAINRQPSGSLSVDIGG